MAAQRVAMQNPLDLQRQDRKTLAHVGVAGRKPHPHADRQRDHRGRLPPSASTAAANSAASTKPVIRIRAPVVNSISIVPPPGTSSADAGIAGTDSATTTAGTKPTCCSAVPVCSARNDRGRCSSCERAMPYRRAVADTWRGPCKLSSTILSFSSSGPRRRRPPSP